ncbi:MAG TPA: glycosyltransferase family 2 protein [Solirubrobacteraceae bacterium]
MSIVTVVKNGRRHLQSAMESVAHQDYPHIEYIVIDGGSTDGTVELIDRNASAISRWVSEPDRGIYDAMNKGIAFTTGAIVKLLNADDVLTDGSVSAAVAAYRSGARGVITGGMEVIDAEGRALAIVERPHGITPFGGFAHPSWYVARDVYVTQGLYSTRLSIGADYEMFVRLHAAAIPFNHLGTLLVGFRTGGASYGLSGMRDRFLVNEHYFGRRAALTMAARQGAAKLRRRAVESLLGQRATFKLRRFVRR